jgi:hypothetical protein
VAPLKNRVERLEQQARFRDWLRFHRYLDGMSVEQLEFFAVFGYWPDPPPLEPPKGTSRLDSMSQKELLKLFEADQRELARFASLNETDKLFFIFHGHWPEAACEESSCRKSFSDELHRKYGSRRAELEGANFK